MSLLDRITARTVCAVANCSRERAPDASVCRDNLNALWRNQLTRQPDGSYLRRRTFTARELWRAAA